MYQSQDDGQDKQAIDALGSSENAEHLSISGLPGHFINGLPVRLKTSRGRTVYAALKRTTDVVFSAAAILIFFPFVALLCIGIALENRGKLFEHEQRVGRNGREFKLLKFTSGKDRSGLITQLVSRLDLDELPVLLCVLRGDMSLIGPSADRPFANLQDGHLDEIVAYYDYRLQVRPGLTGWAQVNHKGGSFPSSQRRRDRLLHDVAYIQNQSLVLDLKIAGAALRQQFTSGFSGNLSGSTDKR